MYLILYNTLLEKLQLQVLSYQNLLWPPILAHLQALKVQHSGIFIIVVDIIGRMSMTALHDE